MRERDQFTQSVIETFGRIMSEGYIFNYKNIENLEILRERPNDPAVLYFNHSTKDDLFLAMHLVVSFAGDRLDNVMIPISEWNSHFYNKPEYAALVQLGKKLEGFETPMVVQSYELSGQGDRRSVNRLRTKAFKLSREFIYSLDESLPRGTLMVLSPEGHRSDDSTLLPSEEGAGFIARRMEKMRNRGSIENGYFIPFTILFPKYRGPKLHYRDLGNPRLKTPVTLEIGEPLSISGTIKGTEELTRNVLGEGKERRDPKSMSHFLMWSLTKLLPDHMHGIYSADRLQDTLSGRYDLRFKGGRRSRDVGIFDKWNREFFDKNLKS